MLYKVKLIVYVFFNECLCCKDQVKNFMLYSIYFIINKRMLMFFVCFCFFVIYVNGLILIDLKSVKKNIFI